MKHENIIMLIALTIFWMASVEISYSLPFLLGEVYSTGNYNFDLTPIENMIETYACLILAVIPLIIWTAGEIIISFYKKQSIMR